MQEQDNLSHRQSFQLIEQMISAAKDEHRETGIPWLFWGSLLFLASVSSVILILTENTGFLGIIWTGMLVAGSLIYSVIAIRHRKGIVKTYVEEMLGRFETGFFISLFAMVAGNFLVRGNIGIFGFYYILYAFWLFIHGSAIRFRPLIIGAIANWIAGILIFIIYRNFGGEGTRDDLYAMIVSSIAIFIGFLLPGYLLRRQYKKKLKINK